MNSIVKVFSICRAVLGGTMIMVSGAFAQESDITATVVDDTGAMFEIDEMSFGYDYTFRLSNCVGYCQKTAHGKLVSLPAETTCGTEIIPLHLVQRIQKSVELAEFDVLLINDERVNARLALGHREITTIEGVSELGDFQLPLDNVAAIDIQDQGSVQIPGGWPSPEGGLSIIVTCQSSLKVELKNASIRKPKRGGVFDDSVVFAQKILVTIGAGEHWVEIERIENVELENLEGELNVSLSMVSGTTFEGSLVKGFSRDYFLTGYNDAGRFFVAKWSGISSVKVIN